jgi:hypothetical protein
VFIDSRKKDLQQQTSSKLEREREREREREIGTKILHLLKDKVLLLLSSWTE